MQKPVAAGKDRQTCGCDWLKDCQWQTAERRRSRFKSGRSHQGSDALRFNVTPQKSKKRDNRQKTAQAIPIGIRERPVLFSRLNESPGRVATTSERAGGGERPAQRGVRVRIGNRRQRADRAKKKRLYRWEFDSLRTNVLREAQRREARTQ